MIWIYIQFIQSILTTKSSLPQSQMGVGWVKTKDQWGPGVLSLAEGHFGGGSWNQTLNYIYSPHSQHHHPFTFCSGDKDFPPHGCTSLKQNWFWLNSDWFPPNLDGSWCLGTLFSIWQSWGPMTDGEQLFSLVGWQDQDRVTQGMKICILVKFQLIFVSLFDEGELEESQTQQGQSFRDKLGPARGDPVCRETDDN